MAQPLVLEGTAKELKHALDQFPNSRFRLELLPESRVDNDQPESAHPELGSLYDLLGDYVGCVEGNGENNAARSGELFSEYVSHKQHIPVF